MPPVDEDEVAVVRAQAIALSKIPVAYPDDFEPDGDLMPRKIPVFQVDIGPPPNRKGGDGSADPIKIKIESVKVKPPISLVLSVRSEDSIATIKKLLAAQPRVPPAEWQSLLLDGKKALDDGKKLKDYPVGKDSVIKLYIKPGYVESDATIKDIRVAIDTTPISVTPRTSGTLTKEGSPAGNIGHVRVPSLVISETPTGPSLPLSLDIIDPPMRPATPSTPNSYHAVITSPGFWQRMHQFLVSEFRGREDADAAFEEFLVASKSSLSAGEIAKIRDAVGVLGMAGT